MTKKDKMILLVAAGLFFKYITKKLGKINTRIDGCSSRIYRANEYVDLYAKIIHRKDRGLGLGETLEGMGVKNIAIYGKGTLGDEVQDDLEHSNVHIECYIDKFAKEDTHNGLPVFSFSTLGEMESVDLILVTPIHAFHSVMRDLYAEGRDERVISLKELIK